MKKEDGWKEEANRGGWRGEKKKKEGLERRKKNEEKGR